MLRSNFSMEKKLLVSLCILAVCGSALAAANKPCAAVKETSGYVCVCNATYCDTIARPTKLKSGKFWHYWTSATSPGFNSKKNSFGDHSEVDGNVTAVEFDIDASTKFQTFQGMGAGFSDSAAINYGILSDAVKEKFIETFFSETGLEYVFVRVPIGATDFSTRFYTYDDTPGDVDLKDFSLVDEDTKYRIPMMLAAKKASSRGIKPLATPWTAPKWMKLNNDSTTGYLRTEYQSVYANYLYRYLTEYKKQGVDYWGISQGNEIIMFAGGQGVRMPNMAFLPPQMKTWTRDHFGPLLKNSSDFKDIVIITLDDERSYLNWYARELLDDNSTASYVDGAALHWYGDNPSNARVLDAFYEKYNSQNKFVIFTEASLGSGGGPHGVDSLELGSWSNAETYIASVFQNINHYVIGYVDWNILLNMQGGPYTQMSLEASAIINSDGSEFYKNPFFYALGHFSKFITPGAQRINVTSDQSDNYFNDESVGVPTPPGPPPTGGGGPTGGPGPQPTGGPGPGPQPTGGPGPGPQPTTTPSTTLTATAFLNPDGSHSFIVYNPQSSAVTVTIKDSAKGNFKATVEAQSLNTFVYW